MHLSRLAIAAVIALRSVLIYGEATSGTAGELTWRDVLPLPRLRPRTGLPAPAPAVRAEAAS
jgi:hypothetical protein